MTRNYAGLSQADFEEAFRKLLPRGLAFNRQAGSVQDNFFKTLAGAVAAVHARSGDLSEREAWPPTSVELLSAWEQVLGLPDPCLGANPVTAARQAAVAARLAATGGQSAPYYQQLAQNLGAQISITEYAPFRAGVNRGGDPLYCQAWAYAWLVTLLNSAVFRFQAGVSRGGEPLWQVANQPVQCEIRRVAPGHTQVDFTGGF